MRRPWMKRLQWASTRMFGPEREVRAKESLKRQNAFALKHGLKVLTLCITLLLASAMITGAYMLLLKMKETGALEVPRGS